MPISGLRVTCQSCGNSFWVTGDTLASTFEFHLDDADRHFGAKRYSACVISLGQCWESFLRLAAQSTYVYHPYFATEIFRRGGPDTLNSLYADLNAATAKFKFQNWRNLFANTILGAIRPATIDEAPSAIESIAANKMGDKRKDAELYAAGDVDIRETVRQLYALTVPTRRNKAIHDGYHPSRAEALVCREDEIVFLFRLKHAFRVGSFNEISAGAV